MALTVPTIFTAVDKVSSVIAKMQGNVGKFASESQKKYAQMSRSAQNWSNNSRQIAVSAGIMGAALVAPLVLATKAAADFEDQMANIGTIVGEKNLPFLNKGVLDVLKKTPVPLHDLTEALYKITSAGVPAAKSIDVLSKSAQLGVAGRGTAVEAADALTSAMNVFKDEGLSTNKVMSMLFQTVKFGKTTISGLSESFGATANIVHSGGVSMKDFLAATAAMTVMGEPASQAMNQIRASVFGLEKPTTRMKYIFSQLGVRDIHQLIGRFGNLGNAMEAIENKGKKLGVNMGQAWGKVGSYAAVIALTGARGKGAYNNNLSAMGSSEEDFAVAYALKLKTMNAQLQLVKNNMLDFSIVLGTTLIPILTRILPKISAFIDGIAKWVENHKTLTGWILKGVGALGLFLLAVAAIAMPVSLIADMVKIYAGIQLFFASSTATATAAVSAEAAAVAGAGTQLSLFATGAAAAESAVAGLLATLSAFAMPAALIAALAGLAALAIYDNGGHAVETPQQRKMRELAESRRKQIDSLSKTYESTLPATNSISGIMDRSRKVEAFRDSLYSKNDLMQNKDYTTLAAPEHVVQRDNLGTITVNIHDPSGLVSSVDSSGKAKPVFKLNQGSIPVKSTSTTGNK